MLIYSGIIGCLLLCFGFINGMGNSFDPWVFETYAYNTQSSEKKATGIPDLYKESIKQFPPLLEHFCAADPNEYQAENLLHFSHEMYCGKNVNPHDILYHAKKICLDHHLSLQTTHAVLDLCKDIIQEQPVDLTNPLLSYNPMQELAYKHDLINRMPTIMRDLCITMPDEHYTRKCMQLLLNQKHDFDSRGIDYAITYNVGCLLYEKLEQIFFSPQTIVRLHEEFRAVVHHNSIPPNHPYSADEELNHKLSLIQHFPSPLIEYCSKDVDKFYPNGLIACAYMLWYPDTRKLLSSYKIGDIEESAAFYIKAIVGMKNPQLVSEFIKKFKALSAPVEIHVPLPLEKNEFLVIDTCFTELCDRILVDGTMFRSLMKLLENRYTKLRSIVTADKTASEKYNNPEYVEGELCEELPNCPICLELFADQFKPKINSNVGNEHILGCGHSICTFCLQGWQKNCPMCRQ
jgi:hypothetical protein